MTYEKHYILTDDIISHLDKVVPSIKDDFISSRYVGFVTTAAVTSYEKAIKSIFINFSSKKHKTFGFFTQSYFSRLNGRIKIEDLKNQVAKYGNKYSSKFNYKIIENDKIILSETRISLISCYSNIIQWRNKFVHEGEIPTTVTYAETVKSYQTGKEMIKCLFETMQR